VYSQKRVLEIKSHRVRGVPEGSLASSTQGASSVSNVSDAPQLKLAVAELQDKIHDQEEELIQSRVLIREAKTLEAARKREVKDLNASLSGANESIRCLKVELSALNARHEESMRLSETFLAEARLSRDEEVARVEEQLDAVKGFTGELRQENEVLKSQMKKFQQSKRDAERELQRAVNKFEAAVQSLEQMEHQYSLLEKDAQETEAVKMERILSLEQEVEDLRVAKGNVARRLEQTAEALREAEQRQLKAEESRSEAVAERTKIQSKLERLEALVDKVTSENQALMASQAKLQGASDGAAEMTRSMQSMLQTYEKENAALVSDLSDMRGRLAVMEERRREEQDVADAMRKRAGKAERQVEEQAREASAREEALGARLEALERNQECQEKVWMAERESLKREVELLVGQLSVATVINRTNKASTTETATGTTQAAQHTPVEQTEEGDEPPSSSKTPYSQTFYSADDTHTGSASMTVSIGTDGIAGGEPDGDSSIRTPATVTSWSGDSHGHRTARTRQMSSSGVSQTTTQTTRTKTSGDKADLRAQLNALKLSLLSEGLSTPAHPTHATHATHEVHSGLSKVSHVGRTSTATSLSGYLQAHRPRALPDTGTATAEGMLSSSSEEDEEEEADVLDGQLEMTRNRIHRAKTLLRRSDRHT
jgi:hypothetical protein